ncbi:MAG: helix-turn-helix domain-containing protein [Bacteroidota bacterium]
MDPLDAALTPLTLTPPQVALLIGAAQGAMLSLASLLRHDENRTASRLFAAILFMLVLMMLGLVRGFSQGPAFPTAPPEDAPYFVLHASGVLPLVLGPLVYFYTRTSVDASYLYTPTRLLHALPALLHLSLLVPLLFVGGDLRADYVAHYTERGLYRSMIPGVPLGLIVTGSYVIAAFVWIRRFERHVTQVASFDVAQRVRWLKWFTGLVVVLIALLGVFRLRAPYQLLGAGALTTFMSTLTLIALVRPTVFHSIPPALRLTEEDARPEKYGTSQLTEAQKTSHLETLLQHFDADRPYLRTDLTLSEVADQIEVPQRYVSQVINEKLDQHFMDFVNGYRVEAAKTMLVDAAWAHLTIDGIAGEAGFNSRSAFYAAFKKATGTTPGAFRRAV